MTTPADATPAAAPEGATPAAAAAPVVEDKKTGKSLLDAAVPATDPPPADAAADPKDAKTGLIKGEAAKWFFADGTPGEGDPPEWFKATKYKTVEEQAKAYNELEKRLGAFVGAPKDGKYEFKLPEGINGELDESHPLLAGFNKWAVEKQINNEAYNELLGMFAQYEASLAPDMNEVLKRVGEKADERIANVTNWARANLQGDNFEIVREALSGANADVVFKALEAVVAKTRQPALPKPGQDVPGAAVTGLAAIQEAHAKRGPDGKLLVETDLTYRAKVDKMYQQFYAQQGQAA